MGCERKHVVNQIPQNRIEELQEVSQQVGQITWRVGKELWIVGPSGAVGPVDLKRIKTKTEPSPKIESRSSLYEELVWQDNALKGGVPDKDAVNAALNEVPGFFKALKVEGKKARQLVSQWETGFYNAETAEQAAETAQHILSQHGVLFESVNKLSRENNANHRE